MNWNWFVKWWKKCFFLTFSHYWGWISNASAPATYAKGSEIISVHGRPVGAAITSDSIDQWIVQACEETRLWRTWCFGSLHPSTLLNVAHSILHVTYKPSEYATYIIVLNSNQITPCISASFTDRSIMQYFVVCLQETEILQLLNTTIYCLAMLDSLKMKFPWQWKLRLLPSSMWCHIVL